MPDFSEAYRDPIVLKRLRKMFWRRLFELEAMIVSIFFMAIILAESVHGAAHAKTRNISALEVIGMTVVEHFSDILLFGFFSSLIVTPFLAFAAHFSIRKRGRALPPEYCANCAYPTEGLIADRCPECGEAIGEQRR